MIAKSFHSKNFTITSREWYLRQVRYFCTDTRGKKGLTETSRPYLISVMCPDLPHPTHRFEPEDTFGDILFLRLWVGHLCPKDRVLSGVNNALLCAKAELFSTTRDRKRKFEVPEGVVFMNPGKLWKKKRVSHLLMCITVLLTVTDTNSLVQLRLGATVSLQSQLVIRWEWMSRRNPSGGEDLET